MLTIYKINMPPSQRSETPSAFFIALFQEYFTALFLSQRDAPQIKSLIEKAIRFIPRKFSCMPMLIDINQAAFEEKYFTQNSCNSIAKL